MGHKALNIPPRLLRYTLYQMKRFGLKSFAVLGLSVLVSAGLSACGTSQPVSTTPVSTGPVSTVPVQPPQSSGSSSQGLVLRDKVIYSQKDPRWSTDLMGKTSDTMGGQGCLVTATSMALTNLGFQTNPKDLNQRLTQTDSYTDRGWLIWDGIRRVTGGRAVATYYDKVDAPTIDGCMRRGEYPMVQFFLPNGRSHWAMIVKHDARGYHMRDPLRISEKPLIFPAGVNGYRAVRCIGLVRS